MDRDELRARALANRQSGDLLLEGANYSDEEGEWWWEDLSESLGEILEERNPSGIWLIEVESLGWQKFHGHKEVALFDPSDGGQFLTKVLPDTMCSFKIYAYGEGGVSINNYHHDNWDGSEWYYCSPNPPRVLTIKLNQDLTDLLNGMIRAEELMIEPDPRVWWDGGSWLFRVQHYFDDGYSIATGVMNLPVGPVSMVEIWHDEKCVYRDHDRWYFDEGWQEIEVNSRTFEVIYDTEKASGP